jgi:hypothetical protein
LWPQIFCLLLQKLVQWRLTWQTERQHRWTTLYRSHRISGLIPR